MAEQLPRYPDVDPAPLSGRRKVGLYLGLVDGGSQADPRPTSGWAAVLVAVVVGFVVMCAGIAVYVHLAHGGTWSHAFGSALVPSITYGLVVLAAEYARRRRAVRRAAERH